MSLKIIGKENKEITIKDGKELNGLAAYMAICERRKKCHTKHEANEVINNIAICLDIDFKSTDKIKLIEYLTMSDEDYKKTRTK